MCVVWGRGGRGERERDVTLFRNLYSIQWMENLQTYPDPILACPPSTTNTLIVLRPTWLSPDGTVRLFAVPLAVTCN